MDETCILKINKPNNVGDQNKIIYLDQMFVEKISLEEYKKNTISNQLEAMTAFFGEDNTNMHDQLYQFIDNKTKFIDNADLAILFIKKLQNLGLVKEKEIEVVQPENPFAERNTMVI